VTRRRTTRTSSCSPDGAQSKQDRDLLGERRARLPAVQLQDWKGWRSGYGDGDGGQRNEMLRALRRRPLHRRWRGTPESEDLLRSNGDR
jgi:hypothetical protein